MRQVWKLAAIFGALTSIWIALLLSPDVPEPYSRLLPYVPIYAVMTLGCYALGRVGYGLMVFPTCPEEAVLLHKDIAEARAFYKEQGIDVGLIGLSE